MGNVFIWSAVLFGVVIGWIVAFFMRNFKVHTTKVLSKTIGVFLGGTGFTALSFIEDTSVGVYAIMFYLLGVAIGFFAFWLYQLVVSFCFKARFVSSWEQYTLFSSCSIPQEKQQYYSSLGKRCDVINSAYKQLMNKDISELEFAEFTAMYGLTEEELSFLICESNSYLLLDDDILSYIASKKLFKK